MVYIKSICVLKWRKQINAALVEQFQNLIEKP
jgi:hypothetical protein